MNAPPRPPIATILAAVLTAALAAVASACTYDPHPANGALACSTPANLCPQGYTCDLVLGTCFSDSATGSGGAASTGSGGASGTGGASAGTGGGTSGQVSSNASDYIGMWTFGLAATVDTTCSDGSTSTNSLADLPTNRQILTVKSGPSGGATLVADWLCAINLDVDGSGAHLGSGLAKCTAPRAAGAPATDPTTSTWTATRYDLTVRMNDRGNATLVADYTRVDTYADARVVTCTQKVRAPLHKQ